MGAETYCPCQFTEFCDHARRIFSVLSAILYLGNVTYKTKSNGREEDLEVGPPEVLARLSELLKVTFAFAFTWLHTCLVFVFNLCGGFPQVKEELLVEALTKRKTVTVNDKLILPYSHSEVGPPFLEFSDLASVYLLSHPST